MTQKSQGRKRGRRALDQKPIIVRITLTLHPDEDNDLIELYRRTPSRKRATITKMTMRAGGVQLALTDTQEDEEALLQAAEGFLC